MNYEHWLTNVPADITADPLWKVKAYRRALFAADIGWQDVTKLLQDKRTIGLASQLYEALGSIGANLSEGYSRGSGKDRVRFYEYSLGSARESRTWYFSGRHVLGEAVTAHRIQLLSEMVRLLLTMIPEQRSVYLKEDSSPYPTSSENQNPLATVDVDPSQTRLNNVPIP
jgi:four helix bundle protein